MGRVADAVKDWVQEQIDKLTAWLREYIAQQLEAFALWLRLAKFDFKVWLSEFTATTHGFWIFIGVIIAGVVLSVYVQQTDAWIKLSGEVTILFEKIKNGFGSILAKTGYSLINTGHNIGMLLNDDYAAAWGLVYDGISAVSEEIHLGISTVTLAIRNVRNLVYVAATFAGQDNLAAEIAYNDLTTTFLERIEGRMRRYVENPQLLFNDIDREIVWPQLEVMQAGQGELLGKVLAVESWISEKTDEITDMRDAFDQLVVDMPQEVEESLNLHWLPLRDRVDNFYADYITPYQETVDAIIGEVGAMLLRQQTALDLLMARYDSPGDMLAAILLLPEPARSIQLARVYAIFNYAGWNEAQLAASHAERNAKTFTGRINEYLASRRNRSIVTFAVPRYVPKKIEDTTFGVWYKGMGS